MCYYQASKAQDQPVLMVLQAPKGEEEEGEGVGVEAEGGYCVLYFHQQCY
jgi:hypothetical protein